MNDAFEFYLDEEIERFEVHTINKDKYVGYLNYSLEKGVMYILDVLLEKPFRQKGVGSSLMYKVIEIAKNNECSKVSLGTQWNDEPVHGFYRKHGFDLISIKDGEATFELVFKGT